MERSVIGKQFMHSCNVRTRFGSSVVVKERVKYSDGSIEPNIVIYDNPKRSFYLTQPRYRNHKYKLEYELISKLDKYVVEDSKMRSKIATLLDLPSKKYISNAALFQSPYIYGADISIEALIKMRYLDTYPDVKIPPTYGFFDIETSIDTNQIILISFVKDMNVYTTALRAFCYNEVNGVRVAVTEAELIAHSKLRLSEYAIEMDVKKRLGVDLEMLNYDLRIFDTEISMIAWIMSCINNENADFIGVWNINFDIPKVIDAIKRASYRPIDLFSHPSVPEDMRYFDYRVDERPVDHFTLKWHWLFSTCCSQFIDSLGLYSQCRRTHGYKARYDLDSILYSEIGLGKMKLSSGQSHVIMQRHHFMDYTAYNIVDVVGLNILEKKNNDILSMQILSGTTPVRSFASATVKVTNTIYWDLIREGKVLACTSSDDDFVKFDKLFVEKIGGTVLSPSRVSGVGVNLEYMEVE